MKKSFYLGIFLISLATLMLEIFLIRFFSITHWYHFAFMIISIALFGIAASGTFLSIKELRNPLASSAILFSITAFLGLLIVNEISFDPFKALSDFNEIFKLALYYLILSLPFFFFGIIIASSFKSYQESSGKIYFYNLLGSSIGSLLALPLISLLNIKLIVIISFIALLAAFSFSQRKILILMSLLTLSLLLLPIQPNISSYKELEQALNYPNSEHLLTKYNSFSRVDVVKSSFTRYAPGLSSKFEGNLPEQLGILIDGSGMNAITEYKNLEFINYLPTALPFTLTNNPKTLIINAGAGLDVLVAFQYNATVTSLESNPIVINLLKEDYKEFSGNIYNKAIVINEEGRSFIKQPETYDIIIISLAGNVLTSSAGLTSLSENYLLTSDAFKDYYNNLNDNGFLLITRWLLYPPKESLKLFSLALTIEDAKDKVAMYRSWTTVTLLLSKKPLDPEEIEKIKDFTQKNRFDIIYLPANFTPNIYAKFKEPYYYNAVQELLSNQENFTKNYLFDISAPSDNNPFYFNFFKLSKLPELYKAIGERWLPFFDPGFLLILLFIQALVLSVVFILLPLKFFKKIKTRKITLAYFFFIGLSYLFIEILLIQKLILLFGQVIYATSATIFSMLLFSSIGSLISQKFKPKDLKKVILLLAILIIIYLITLSSILNALITLPLSLKLIISTFIIAPLAFVMGIPFPLGIRAINKELIPWAWSINGSASVLSTIIATLLALYLGYNPVLLLAAFFYLLALLAIIKLL